MLFVNTFLEFAPMPSQLAPNRVLIKNETLGGIGKWKSEVFANAKVKLRCSEVCANAQVKLSLPITSPLGETSLSKITSLT